MLAYSVILSLIIFFQKLNEHEESCGKLWCTGENQVCVLCTPNFPCTREISSSSADSATKHLGRLQGSTIINGN